MGKECFQMIDVYEMFSLMWLNKPVCLFALWTHTCRLLWRTQLAYRRVQGYLNMINVCYESTCLLYHISLVL